MPPEGFSTTSGAGPHLTDASYSQHVFAHPYRSRKYRFLATELTNPGGEIVTSAKDISRLYTSGGGLFVLSFFFARAHNASDSDNYDGRLSRIMSANFHRRRKSAPTCDEIRIRDRPGRPWLSANFPGHRPERIPLCLCRGERDTRVSRGNRGLLLSIRRPSFFISTERLQTHRMFKEFLFRANFFYRKDFDT